MPDDPKAPYWLTEMDRRFLKAIRIKPENDRKPPDALPLQPPSKSQADGFSDDEDGA